MSTPDDDSISAFYDQHPYPPPITDLAPVRQAWDDGRLRRIEHFRMWPTLPYRDEHSILIAGCGTSQAARYAARYPRARVVGIDVSAASLQHSETLASEFGLDNLELHRLPIEQVDQLGITFDQVVSTGVLHHLADPEAGLRALHDVLAPGGAMQLMLYAPYGRTGVYMIQDYCRLLGIEPEPAQIAELVVTLHELPRGHPLGHLLRDTPDFERSDALADALLNPRDRAYSVPEIDGLLTAAGLRFGRWVRQAPYVPQCGVLRTLPHGRQIAELPLMQQFAAVELFRGTMTRHSLICHRQDDPGHGLRFGDDAWHDYVPIRTATAIAVEQNVPAGAAAALLNTAHTYPDLVLLVSAAEKRSFDAIDGETAISDLSTDNRQFFEQLWWQDLVVFDARTTTSGRTAPLADDDTGEPVADLPQSPS